MAFSEGDHAIMNEIARQAAKETVIEMRREFEDKVALHAANCPIRADVQRVKGGYAILAACGSAIVAFGAWVVSWFK